MEHPHQPAVSRCTVGRDAGLEVSAPDGRTTRTHLEGSQLVHTWTHLMSDTRDVIGQVCRVGVGLTPLLRRLLQVAPGNQVDHLVVLRRQHRDRLGDVL